MKILLCMNMFNKGARFRYGRSKRCSLQRERETLGHLVLVCRGSIAIFVQSIAKFEILNLYKIRINGTVCNSLVWFILFIFNRSLRVQIFSSYDSAKQLFQQMYGELKPKSSVLGQRIRNFNQNQFIQGHGMADEGYFYVPSSCQSGVRLEKDYKI